MTRENLPQWSGSLRKSGRVCEFWEDFEFLVSSEGAGAAIVDPIFEPVLNGVQQKILMFGQTRWGGFGSGEVNSCTLDHLGGEQNHPGIVRFTTSGADNDFGCIFRGNAPNDAWVAGSAVRSAETCMRLTTTTSVACFFGFCEDLVDALDFTTPANSNIIGFIYDTDNAAVDVNWHAITREADGTAVVTDTGVAVGAAAWETFEIRQDDLGTIHFFIDSRLVATHTTQVPDTELMNFGIHFRNRSAASRVLSLDYIALESHALDRSSIVRPKLHYLWSR